MDDPDIALLVTSHLGNTIDGYLAQLRARPLNLCYKNNPIFLPKEDGICDLPVSLLLTHTSDLAHHYLSVLDIVSCKIVHVACASLFLNFTDKPQGNKSLRFSVAHERFVWLAPRSSSWLSVSAAQTVDIPSLVTIPFSEWRDRLQLSSDLVTESSCGEVVFGRKRRLSPPLLRPERVRLLLQRINLDLVSPVNRDIHTLRLETADCDEIDPSAFVDCLSSLALTGFNLSQPCSFFSRILIQDRLVHLNLSGVPDKTFLVARSGNHINIRMLAEILAKWSADTVFHSLILDNIVTDSLEVFVCAGCPSLEFIEFTAESDTSYTFGGSNGVYLSMSACCNSYWNHAISSVLDDPLRFSLAKSQTVVPVGNSVVHPHAAAPIPAPLPAPISAPIPAPMAPIPPPSAPIPPIASALNPAATFATSYSNHQRERDRYMWQWFDYKCKGCGEIWPKNSVTISFRQTCVSECLHGKRKCQKRTEFTRMKNGELWITDKHVFGNGGLDLTPKPADVLAAETQSRLVGINALDKTFEYFYPHPTRDGLKVPAV